jgi:TrmH family RNA methyltransferase
MKHITSRDNPHFKLLNKLAHSSRERRKAGLMLLDGVHLLEASARLDEVLVAAGAVDKSEIAAWLAAHAEAKVLCLADGLFNELAAVDTPSGIMALAPLPQPAAAPRRDVDCILLDGVQDPGNLGSILRSAAAAGCRQALLSADCAQAWSPRALRAGQGAHFLFDIHEGQDLSAFLADYAGTSVTTALDTDYELFDAPLDGPLAWVFGAEGQGVSAAVAAAAKLKVRIPMPGGSESLNVAAAAAVCLFEAVRRRRQK